MRRYVAIMWTLLGACANDLASLVPFPCATDGTCPEGLVCASDVCTHPACELVTVISDCDACGAAAIVPCPDGTACPANSACGGNSCFCNAGYEPRDCTGRRCNGQCTHPDLYWCAPTGPVPAPTCDELVTAVTSECTCADGRGLRTKCGDVLTCEERCRRCDLVAQTCGEGEKCSMTDDDLDGYGASSCVPVRGSLGEGAACTRPGEMAGHDDCAPGLFCTRGTTAARVCRTLCYDDIECPQGQRCNLLSRPIEVEGFCAPTCELFGDDCEPGRKCSLYYATAPKLEGDIPLVPYCAEAGPRTNGASCDATSDCGIGLICALVSGAERCVAHCDETHPCATGDCQPRGGLPNDAGWCSE